MEPPLALAVISADIGALARIAGRPQDCAEHRVERLDAVVHRGGVAILARGADVRIEPLHNKRGGCPGSIGRWRIGVPSSKAIWTTSPVPPRPRGNSPSQMAISRSQCAIVARPAIR
jgi:hypothetical protein